MALVQPPAQLLAEPESRARFIATAQVAATLNHPHIAALFDVVQEDGRCYLAYELLTGPSLRQEMAGLRMGVSRSIEIGSQIADGLADGHSRGVVHGDLRPETVIVTARGSTKILNFGLTPWTPGGAARARAARTPGSLTPDEASIAAYLTPEEALGGASDARSDVFALGVLLYEMLTGRQPFEAGTLAATIDNLVGQAALPASAHNADVPPALDALLARAMSKQADARQQTAAVLAAELRAVARGPATPKPVPPIALDERRGSAGWWVAAGVVAVALWWWWWR